MYSFGNHGSSESSNPAAVDLWFGIGFQSKAFLVFLFSVFTILYNTVTGAKECKKGVSEGRKSIQSQSFPDRISGHHSGGTPFHL